MSPSTRSPTEVRAALLRQWSVLTDGIRTLDLDRPSRLDGWRNREVVAHLAAQPMLLGRFLQTAGPRPPEMTLTDNLAGTRRLAAVIDDAAATAAAAGQLDLAASVAAVTTAVCEADLAETVTTLQGSIRLVDYLVTRCVESVVHGRDLVPAVEPDAGALGISAEALTTLLEQTEPPLVHVAEALPPLEWVEMATGRRAAPAPLAAMMPLLS
jgi:hypothetical protein